MTLPSVRSLWGMAFALSLGAAISLGMARFSYGLLLPPMRDDLAWSYTLAGAMNTANALGYLLGAMALPRMLRTPHSTTTRPKPRGGPSPAHGLGP